MSQFDSAVKVFKQEMNSLGLHYHEELYHAVAKHLGPSIHDQDASLVACTDPAEVARIKQNFLIGKLGLEDSPRLDAAIHEICGGLGKSNTGKHRVTFYYLLVAILGQEEAFLKQQ